MTGRVADEDAVPNAVVKALVMLAMNLQAQQVSLGQVEVVVVDLLPEWQLPGTDGEDDRQHDEPVEEEAAHYRNKIHA